MRSMFVLLASLLGNLAFAVCFFYSRGMNAIGLIVSFAGIGVILVIGILMAARWHVKSEYVRKFIHIGVSNWWFFLLFMFDDIRYAIVGPIVFIIANAAAVFSGAAGILGVSDKRRNLGLIYFPISLLLLILGFYLDVVPVWAAGIGAVTMGYADGLAALAGIRWGKTITLKNGSKKSIVGSLVMCFVTLIIVVAFNIGYSIDTTWTFLWWMKAVLIAVAAMIMEAFTPWGFDNLSVPLLTAVLAALVL